MDYNRFYLYHSIGTYIKSSILRNFNEGGRPAKWKPSKRAAKGVWHARKKMMIAGKTLIDKSILRNSIKYTVKDNEIIVGTNVKYAKIHNYGGKISKTVDVRPHKRTITKLFGKPISAKDVDVRKHERNMTINMPARPFMVLQKTDIAFITKKIKDYTDNHLGAKP